jgi:hypothetical protein
MKAAPRPSAISKHDDRDGADSVKRFALKHSISRDQVYKEIAAGRLTARKVASRTIITFEDGARWRRSLPKMTPGGEKAKRPNGRGVADRGAKHELHR